jgi:hypothetical protein
VRVVDGDIPREQALAEAAECARLAALIAGGDTTLVAAGRRLLDSVGRAGSWSPPVSEPVEPSAPAGSSRPRDAAGHARGTPRPDSEESRTTEHETPREDAEPDAGHAAAGGGTASATAAPPRPRTRGRRRRRNGGLL